MENPDDDNLSYLNVWRDNVAKYLTLQSTTVSLIDLINYVPRPPSVPSTTSILEVIQTDPQQRFAVSGEGPSIRVRRIFRVDDEEIKEHVNEWRRLLAEYLSSQSCTVGLSDIGSNVARPYRLPSSVKLIDVLRSDPLNRFIITGEGNSIRAKFNFHLTEEQIASLVDQWRDNICRFLTSQPTTVGLSDIGSHVSRPFCLPNSIKLLDTLQNDPQGRFAISGEGSSIRARRVFRVDDEEIFDFVEEWRKSICRFLYLQYVPINLSDIGSSVFRPPQLPFSVKLVDVMRADPFQRFILSGDGNSIRAVLTPACRADLALTNEVELPSNEMMDLSNPDVSRWSTTSRMPRGLATAAAEASPLRPSLSLSYGASDRDALPPSEFSEPGFMLPNGQHPQSLLMNAHSNFSVNSTSYAPQSAYHASSFSSEWKPSHQAPPYPHHPPLPPQPPPPRHLSQVSSFSSKRLNPTASSFEYRPTPTSMPISVSNTTAAPSMGYQSGLSRSNQPGNQRLKYNGAAINSQVRPEHNWSLQLGARSLSDAGHIQTSSAAPAPIGSRKFPGSGSDTAFQQNSLLYSSNVGKDETVPFDFLCSLSNQLMRDPVIAADGFVYDRANIEQWLKSSSTSPVTEKDLTSRTLTPCTLLRERIEVFSQHRPALFPSKDPPRWLSDNLSDRSVPRPPLLPFMGDNRLSSPNIGPPSSNSSLSSPSGVFSAGAGAAHDADGPPPGLLGDRTYSEPFGSIGAFNPVTSEWAGLSIQEMMGTDIDYLGKSLNDFPLPYPQTATRSPSLSSDGKTDSTEISPRLPISAPSGMSLVGGNLQDKGFSRAGQATISEPAYTVRLAAWLPELFAGFEAEIVDHIISQLRDEGGFVTAQDLLDVGDQLNYNFMKSICSLKIGHFNRLLKGLSKFSSN